MSASPVARSISQVKNIPTRRMLITDINQLPSEYSSTPGGTLYSTTPGGTHIVYERSFLMNLRNSPMSQTPPKTGTIPNCILKCSPPRVYNNNNNTKNITITVTPDTNNEETVESNSAIDESDEQFAMEI